jgi:hypothetical protein
MTREQRLTRQLFTKPIRQNLAVAIAACDAVIPTDCINALAASSELAQAFKQRG